VTKGQSLIKRVLSGSKRIQRGHTTGKVIARRRGSQAEGETERLSSGRKLAEKKNRQVGGSPSPDGIKILIGDHGGRNKIKFDLGGGAGKKRTILKEKKKLWERIGKSITRSMGKITYGKKNAWTSKGRGKKDGASKFTVGAEVSNKNYLERGKSTFKGCISQVEKKVR